MKNKQKRGIIWLWNIYFTRQSASISNLRTDDSELFKYSLHRSASHLPSTIAATRAWKMVRQFWAPLEYTELERNMGEDNMHSLKK